MIPRSKLAGLTSVAVLLCGCSRGGGSESATPRTIDVSALLEEMADLEALARRPEPFFRSAMASSYSRASHEGGESWFANDDRGHYVRTDTIGGRTEHVLADLEGPGAVTRIWTANPQRENVARFYFDGEAHPTIEVPWSTLFTGTVAPFDSTFAYVSGEGGNLYYPLPFSASLVITLEETDEPLGLYYEIGHRVYAAGTDVETFTPRRAAEWRETQERVARLLREPGSAPIPDGAERLTETATIAPGETASLASLAGGQAVYRTSVRVLETRESRVWDDPLRAHNAYRFLLLGIDFDGARSVETPLGEFFGSGPGVNPYRNLLAEVDEDGTMTSRFVMPFRRSMDLVITNAGSVPYTVELELTVAPHEWSERDYQLRAQWQTLTRHVWPPFDLRVLDVTGEGKMVGSVYEIANPSLVWWGEGDQKISIDGEPFPSVFGTGTEDDYGFAYGYNGKFVRPFHAQTRVDGPWSGGHVSLNRWYVLDALPYRSAIRFDQEMWHWMPSRATWGSVVFWYARPGTAGPTPIDRTTLAPVDLGIREDQLEPYEGEALAVTTSGGSAASERLANNAGAHHLVWRGAAPGDRLVADFDVPTAGRYSVVLNLTMSPDYGRHAISVNGAAVAEPIDSYSAELFWQQVELGAFDLVAGTNTLEVSTLEPAPGAEPGNLFGLDYIFLTRIVP